MNSKTDVMIVGAGPTGLSLACQLVRYGIDFVILEKNSGVTELSKAIGVQARTLEIYEQLGVVSQALDRGQIAGEIYLLTNGKLRVGVNLSHIGQGLSPYPYLFILEQSENERILYEYLQEHHREVRWNTELEHFTQDERGVTAQVKTADGGIETIAAQYLVGCDGAKSLVRHTLGLSFKGSTIERMFYLADAQVDWAFSHDAGYACPSTSSLTFFFPMAGEGRYRIIGTFPEGLDKDESEISFTEIDRRIKEDTQLSLDISQVNWFSVYNVHTRGVNRFSVGRCFVAGDAAHIHSPAGGQGMNTGIQDAYNLAWKLAFTLKGYAHPRLLETYHEERFPNAQRLLETTDQAFHVMISSNWFWSWIRTEVFPLVAKFLFNLDRVRKTLFLLISQIRINYRNSSLSQHYQEADFKVKAGDRMPYLTIDGESIYSRLHQPKFHLLVFLKTESDLQALNLDWIARYNNFVEIITTSINSQVVEQFGTQDNTFYILLRPDNYIAFVSTEISSNMLRIYLNKYFDNSID